MRSLLLVPVVALVVACGARDEALVDAEQVVAKTGSAATARLELDMDADYVGDFTAEQREELALLTFHATGVTAGHGDLLSMRMRMDRQALGAAGAGDGTFDMIIDSRTGDVWFHYDDALGVELPPGKTWVHMNDESLAGLRQTSDPARIVAYLAGAGTLERVGEERVRGVDTVKYKATLDLDRALEALSEDASDEQRQELEEGLDTAKDLGVEEIPMDVWIDDDGYMRRLDMDWTLGDVSAEEVHLRIHLDMWDFGAPVNVQIPAKSTTIELSELGG